MSPEFLDLEDMLAIHAMQLEEFGGADGIRDQGLLESALAQPQVSLFGEWAHPTLPAMAAAYLFHIVKNHPFLDGNKRAGLAAAVTFLDINGMAIDEDPELYELTMGVAEGSVSKEQLTDTLTRLAR